ncbi:MAG TPA: hypothetical protein VNF07_01765, partial [Acidimicrobiales bacterium]|nr:hypothetical protein [Acidimicrobiales bacterium]
GGLPQTYTGYTRNTVWGNANLEEGGRSVNYKNEDPFIREEYARQLEKHGYESHMDSGLYA